MSEDRCDECGGRYDRPGLFGCGVSRHPICDFAETIVALIEDDLSDRRGMGWGDIDDELKEEIRDVLAERIRNEVRQWKLCGEDRVKLLTRTKVV